MLDVITTFQKKYHLKLGNKPSSPVMNFSAGLVLQYAGNLKNAPQGDRKPFYLAVPNKEHFVTQFCCTLLLNYLFEDYCCADLQTLKIGDKVKIFGSTVKFSGQVDSKDGVSKIRLILRDTRRSTNNRVTVPSHYVSFMSEADPKKLLSTAFGKKNKFYTNNDLNALFDLEVEEALNPSALDSSLFLAAGRGHVGSIRQKLKAGICINQSLADVFQLDRNLILSPDLEKLASVFKTSSCGDNSYFIEGLREDLMALTEKYENDDKVLYLTSSLADKLDKGDFSEDFKKLFHLLAEAIDASDRSRLLGLGDHIPVESAELPDNLRIVVLNGIDLVRQYGNTIYGLVARGIPVVVITDLPELAYDTEGITDRLMDSYRFCWHREEVKKLIDPNYSGYNDDLFWRQCVNYANQQITIRSYNDPAGEKLFNVFESNISFARMDGFELLKKAYYQHLRPALYLLKNTPGQYRNINNIVEEQAGIFSRAFESVKNQLPKDLAFSLADGLSILKEYKSNAKQLPYNQHVFTQLIAFPDNLNVEVPHFLIESLQIEHLQAFNQKALVFTGFPYREWNGRYLFDAVFCQFIPSLTILAWPEEAKRTTGFILKKFRNSGFDDWLPEWISNEMPNWEIPPHNKRPDEADLIIQDGFVSNPVLEPTTQSKYDEDTFEGIQKSISNFRFTDLLSSFGEVGHYLVSVDVLHFYDGSYMLLPHGRGGRIQLAMIEDGVADKIIEASFHEVSLGDVIICFDMNRQVIREITRGHLNEAYELVDQWRTHLENLLMKNDKQFATLETHLNKQKELMGLTESNPSRQNLMRWFYDSDILAPQSGNLHLILQDNGLSKTQAESTVSQIKEAKSVIIKGSNEVSERIKDKAVVLLKNREMQLGDFSLDVDGVSVEVQCGRITDKEVRTGLRVPYSCTKQFIKDQC